MGKRYETEKKIVSNEKGVNQYSTEVGYQIDNQPKSPKTNENLAKEYGVSPATISRSANFTKVKPLPKKRTGKKERREAT